MRFKTLFALCLGVLIGLCAVAFSTPVEAQIGTQGSGVSAGGGNSRTSTIPGLHRSGNALEILTPDGSAPGPLAFGFYTTGTPEPTADNVLWWYCSDDGVIVTCQQRGRYFGLYMVGAWARYRIP